MLTSSENSTLHDLVECVVTKNLVVRNSEDCGSFPKASQEALLQPSSGDFFFRKCLRSSQNLAEVQLGNHAIMSQSQN